MRNLIHNRACIVCRSAAGVGCYADVGDVAYLRCADCGLIFQSELPKPANFSRAYKGSFFKDLKRRIVAPHLKLPQRSGYEGGMQRARQIFNFIAKHALAETGSSQKAILDVGCNKGFLLAAALESKFEVWGVEFVEELMLPFKNTYPDSSKNVFSEKFANLRNKLPENYFDVITLIDVVEHFEDPVTDMSYLKRLLKPTGRMLIQTPDAGCGQAVRASTTWGAMKADEHLYLFNRENFEIFSQACGLEILLFNEPFEEADGNFVAVLQGNGRNEY